MKRLLALMVLLAIVAFYFDRSPLVLPTGGPEGRDVVPYRDTGHPILLLLDPGLFEREASSLAERAADLEWQNILTQGFGGCDILRAPRIAEQPTLLDGRSWIVLPRRTLAELDVRLLEPLARAVAAGSTVLLEAPPAAWAQQLGMDPQGVEARPQLPWPSLESGFRLDGPILPAPSRPLIFPHAATAYRPIKGVLAQAGPLASPAGRPLLWSADQGRGSWRVLTLHLSELATAMRQGQPDDDFRVRDRHREVLPGPLETNDMIVSSDILQSDHPWLDAWIDALLLAPRARLPVATLWPAPYDADGWLLVSHDDEGFGDRSIWMLEEEQSKGLPSTLFLMPSDGRLTADGFAAMVGEEVAVGLHPRLPGAATRADPRTPVQRWGFWKWQPLMRLPSLEEQRRSLAETLGGSVELDLNRFHFLLWTEDVDQAWHWLTGLGLRADTSFGPDWGAAGWIFGSAVPFRPISRRGAEHPIWEVPFHSAETIGQVSRARVRRWMRQNAEGGHGPIHLLFHPDAFGWAPDAELFRLWDELAAIAAETRHQPATLPTLLDHWEARAGTQVRLRAEGERQLSVEIVAPAGTTASLALALPTRWNDAALASWRASSPFVVSRRTRSFGRSIQLFRLPPGTTTLTLDYAP